ncbi:MAG TPA: TonB family protein [Terriglobales bacterium]
MAQHSISRHDSLDPHPPFAASDSDTELNLLELPEIPPPEAFPEVPAEPVPSISADLLNDIVERARISTKASDAAIALRHGEDLICFATTGANAPDIGVRLDLDSGLSGACVQSMKFQLCEDSESDARVDAVLCRRLGIRSVLVYPIIRHERLMGVVEVFSAEPNAFGDSQVQSLAALSRTISYILDRPVETPASGEEFGETVSVRDAIAETAVEEAPIDPEALPAHNYGRSFDTIPDLPEDLSFPFDPAPFDSAELKASTTDRLSVEQVSVDAAAEEQGVVVRDFAAAKDEDDELAVARSSSDLDHAADPVKDGYEGVVDTPQKSESYSALLTYAVIALALALGWLLGESFERQSTPVAQTPAPVVTPAQRSAPVVASKPAANSALATQTAQPTPRKHEAAPAKREADAPAAAAQGELVVSQNGKVIYRQQPQTTAAVPAVSSGPTGISKAVMVSPDAARQFVVKRVEPEYPEAARAAHISGPVTLQAIVAKDGSVKTINTVSGDPQLVAAARQAVSQWQFKPYTQQGRPAEFQTNVTVNFRLPE